MALRVSVSLIDYSLGARIDCIIIDCSELSARNPKKEIPMGRSRSVLLSANLLLGIVLLGATEEVEAGLMCDTGPACQCDCLDAWDECADGLPTEQARELCDAAYEQCWDENCETHPI